MKVLTEMELRSELKKMGPVTSYAVPPGTILTPAARSYLSENKIDIVFADKCQISAQKDENSRDTGASGNIPKDLEETKEAFDKPRFLLLSARTKISDKPEAFTHLQGNKLVPKYHPRIKLRGKIDSLEANLIMAQVHAEKSKLSNLVKDLQEILDVTRSIMRAEVLSEPLEDKPIFGLSEDEIKEISHDPKKSIGINHFMPSHEMGETMAILNLVRTQIREIEIAACDAFCDRLEGPEREDIIRLLNRLSSAVYVMMCWLKAGKYCKVEV